MYQNFNVRKCLLLFAVLLQLTPASAQSKNVRQVVDSLKSLIVVSADTAKYNLFFEIAYQLFDVDNQEAVVYAYKAHQLARLSGDSLRITKSGRSLGQLLRRVSKLDEAINMFTDVLPIAERNKYREEEKRILNALALSYNFKAVYDKALYYNFKSLEIREAEDNKREIGNALNNIGLVYYKMIDLEHALEYYNAALKIKLEANDKEGLDQIFINMALCYVSLKDYDKAIVFVNKAFKECGTDCNDQIIIQGEFCLGKSFRDLKKYRDASLHFNNSYSIAVKIGDKRHMAENLSSLGYISIEENDYKDAIKKLSEAESLSKESGYNQTLINTYLLFSKLYNHENDFKKAAAYQAKYIHLKDSVYSENISKNLTKVQSAYQERVNLKTIDGQNDILKLNEHIIAKVRAQYFFILTIAILTLLLTFVFVRFNSNSPAGGCSFDEK